MGHLGSEDMTRSGTVRAEVMAPFLVALWPGGHLRFPLAAARSYTVGRSLDCEIRLDHATVSRRHAVLRFDGRAEVTDLGSSKGTRVNGAALTPHVAVPIQPGDVLELGRSVVVLHDPSGSTVSGRGAERPAPQMSELVARVAPTPLSVLVVGETGVGKESLAASIHEKSGRKGALVRLNSAALPETLLESELFGYEKGAFTGAERMRQGLLESAHGGTLFLDEVGELPLSAQARLLRALEQRAIRRVGGTEEIAVDVRFVAATNRDLVDLVQTGGFRSDLYFRLNGITLRIAPLRERRDEVIPLAEHFVSEAAARTGLPPPSLSSSARTLLLTHGWPGNVRELKNAVERAVVLCSGVVEAEHLWLGDGSMPQAHAPGVAPRGMPGSPGALASPLRGELDQIERQRIVEAMDRAGGNQSQAAKLLGMSRRTLLTRLDAYAYPRPRKGKP